MADLWYRADAPKIAMIYGQNPRWDSSKAEILQASKYDLIISALRSGTKEQNQKLNDNLKRIHDMNPRNITVSYLAGSIEYPRGKYFSDDCYLRTPEGDLINSWPGSCLLNLTNPDTIDAYMKMVDDLWPHELGVDGVYIDCMNVGFDWWVVEIESKKKVLIDADGDGIADDMEEVTRKWTAGKEEILRRIRAKYGKEPYILVNGSMYADYAKPYADGTIFEGILDHLILPESYTKYTFDEIMEQYSLWSSTPSGRPNCTYIDVSPGFDIEFGHADKCPTDETVRTLQRGYESLRQMRFGLACALLGDGHYTFQLHTRWLGQHWWYQEYDIPIGKPLGNFYKAEDGSYRRDYENAIVVVNMSYHELKPHFEQTMRDGTTGWVGKDFQLPSKDGRIYVRVGL